APITTTCFFVTAFSFRVSVLCLVCAAFVVIQGSLGYRNLLVVAEHVLVTHCFVVLRTTALNDFSPDQAKYATDNDQTGHDVDQRGACFGVDHQLEVDQDHNEHGGQTNGGDTWRNNPGPDAALQLIGAEPRNDCNRGDGQQEHQTECCSVGQPGEQRDDREQLAEFVANTGDGKPCNDDEGKS